MVKLFAKLKNDDQGAVNFVFKKYFRPLCLFAEKMVHDMDKAKEIVGEVFKEFALRKNSFDRHDQLERFFYRNVKKGCEAYLLQKKEEGRAIAELDNLSEDFERTIEDQIMEAEVLQAIEEEFRKLPSRTKAIILFSQTDPVEAVALMFKISKNAVLTTRKKAINKIREALKKRGLLPVVIIAVCAMILYILLTFSKPSF